MEQLESEIATMNTEQFKKFLKTANLETLHKFKIYLDDLYYNTDDSTFLDTRYDMLKDILVTRDKDYVPPVGAALREGDNRVKIPYWLGSADKITPEEPEELARWLKANTAGEYIVSDKLDGVSCLFTYTDGKINMYKRGDKHGEGADISYLAPYFKTIPKFLPENIAVRGELIMKKETFEQKYRGQSINGKTYKNPRNMVNGLTGAKTARKGLEDVMYVVYEIIGDSMPKPSQQLLHLAKLGFTVVKYEKIQKLNMNILSNLLIRYKEESEFEIDGIIVQSNLPYDRNTSGNPDYMFAFKMTTEESIRETTVINIEWNVSKWGQLKPVVIVEPVELEGVTMSRATAHNAKYVEDNKLGPGAVIKIVRSKEVIPYIVEIVIPAENAQMPDVPYMWDKTHVNITIKKYDDIMCVKLLSGFFAKMNIKHVSEATIAKMAANGLDNFIKIITADKERLLQVPEFQDKSAERIYTNIRSGLKNVKLSDFLGASGVFGFGIGKKRMDALLLDIPNLLQVYKTKTHEQMRDMIMDVEGFSHVMAEKIVSSLKYADKLVEKTRGYVTFAEDKRVSNDMRGHKYVMTGFRNKELEDAISVRGGKITGTVSRNTTALIVAKKENKPTGKSQKAHELGIPIYVKEDFMQQFIV